MARFGTLTMFVGPMYAGKTESLLKEVARRDHIAGDTRRNIVLKPRYDDRYSESQIVSHDGTAVEARNVGEWPEDVYDSADAIFIDEIQFFMEPHFSGNIVDGVRLARLRGIDIYCSGLDMDYRGHAFEITALLMAESSQIMRLTASCEICRAPATMTARVTSGTDRLLLGTKDAYKPLCADHWAETVARDGVSQDDEQGYNSRDIGLVTNPAA